MSKECNVRNDMHIFFKIEHICSIPMRVLENLIAVK